LKRFFKIIGYTLLTLVLLVVLAMWLVTTERVQNVLVQKAASYLSDKTKTKVSVGHVKLSFFNQFHIQQVYMEDDKKDTLAYVGDLSVKTSDLLSNYWNDETSVIESVGLDDVFVHLNRFKENDRWNYDFIVDAFSSSPKDTSSKSVEVSSSASTDGSGSGPKIDLKKLSCHNVRFYMDDAWRGEDMRFAFKTLDLDVKSLNLISKQIDINSILVDGANVLVKEYNGGKPKDNTPDDTTTWGTPFNPDLYQLAISKLTLANSAFYFQDGESIPPKSQFDEKHLGISNLNLNIDNAKVIADTLFADIQELTALERSGLEIKSLKGKLRLSQVQAALNEFRLQTAYSTLGDHFEMDYRNFHDFKDFIDKVTLKTTLANSTVSSLDIGYFAPLLNEYPIAINLSGDAEGLIGNLKARDLKVSTLNTRFEGTGSVVGLPDIEATVFDMKVNELTTSGTDLNKLIPQTKTDAVAWSKLQHIQFAGHYHGKVDEFNAKGDLATSLGNAKLDLNMNFKGKQPSYNGHLSTEKFNIGSLVKQNSIGIISLDGEIKGSGFDLNSLNTNVKATISEIELENQVYRNLTINGLVANKKFDGIFISQDPNLALNFDGKLDLSGREPVYNFNSRFLKINFQKLGLTDEPIIGSGYATLNFKGDHIDNFLGTAVLKNLWIEKGGQRFFLEDLSVNSTQSDGVKSLTLVSTLADAELKGNYDISSLASAFQLYLYHYMPQYIDKPKRYKEEAFTFDVKIKEVDSLVALLNPDIKHVSNIQLSGELNTEAQNFSLDANIPKFGYQSLELNNILIVGAGDFSSFDLTANGSEVSYNGEVLIPSYQLVSNMAQDTATLSFNSQSINEILGEATLNAKATAFNDNLYVSVLPSKISIRNDQWQLFSNHQMIFGDRISIRDFRIESGAQQIVVNTKENASNDIEAKFSMIDLEGASAILNMDDVKMFGRISGQVDVINPLGDITVKANLISSEYVRLNNDTLGQIAANVSYDVKDQRLIIDKNTTITHRGSFVRVAGEVSISDSIINLQTELEKVNIAPVGQFVSDYLSNIAGMASGRVDVKGKLSDPQVSGKVNLSNAMLKVLFLGTTYSIANADFNFNNRRIEMDDIILKDERKGNYFGMIRGHITHQNFDDFKLNFNVVSDDLLCMNTRAMDNDLFYGYVPAKVNVSVIGPIDNINVEVDAKPLKGAQFHLPINSSGDISTYDYIKFAKVGRDQDEDDEKATKPYYLNLGLNIDATPDAEVFIVLDQNTGEEIRAKGNGAIKLNVDLGNSINMFGNYVITEGKYLFNFRGLIPREFAIEENSKISWSGDPLEANLDVKAVYKLPKNLPLLPLVNTQWNTLDESDQQEAKRPYTTFVNLMLKGSLATPDIKFDIIQPDNKAIGTAGVRALEQIKNDEKELVSQAGVLLLLGEFKASDGLSNSTYRGSIATVSDMISSALSSEVTNLFQKLTGWKNVSLNLGYQSYADEAANQTNRNEFKVNVSANLLNDRIIVDLGNSVDVGKNADGSTSSNFIGGDFKAQFLISEDGRLRATAYRTNSTNNLDLDSRNFTKSGVGLSYRKVFNNFSDLFVSRKKKRVKPSQVDSLLNKDS
jgi:hypothetical protein